MVNPVKAEIWVRAVDNTLLDTFEVAYNPTELTLEKNVQLAEISIPGLDTLPLQFVHGGLERLVLELFCDTTNETAAEERPVSVTKHTDRLYQLVKVDPATHAPPIAEFIWGRDFPGHSLPPTAGSQGRTSFCGVAADISQRFTLFAENGTPLRATVRLTLVEFRPLETQIAEVDPESPDRTHVHLLSEGDALWSLASRYWQRPDRWRVIADHNGITDPRRLPPPGTPLEVPPLPEATR